MAARKANFEHLKLYFHVGAYVSANTRNGTWGSGAIEAISERLSSELPGLRGFSPTNMRNMRIFHEQWSQEGIHQLPTDELGDCLLDDAVPAIHQLPTDELSESVHWPLVMSFDGQTRRGTRRPPVFDAAWRGYLPHFRRYAARLQGPQAVAGWIAETSRGNECRGGGKAQIEKEGARQMKLRVSPSARLCCMLFGRH